MSDVYKQALERMFGKSTSNIWEGVANGTCLPPKPLPEIEVLQGIASHDYSKTTLRDQFAMAALTGMCNGFNGGSGDVEWFEQIAVKAIWLIADAMMEARK